MMVMPELIRTLWYRRTELLCITRIDHEGNRRLSSLYALATSIACSPPRGEA